MLPSGKIQQGIAVVKKRCRSDDLIGAAVHQKAEVSIVAIYIENQRIRNVSFEKIARKKLAMFRNDDTIFNDKSLTFPGMEGKYDIMNRKSITL